MKTKVLSTVLCLALLVLLSACNGIPGIHISYGTTSSTDTTISSDVSSDQSQVETSSQAPDSQDQSASSDADKASYITDAVNRADVAFVSYTDYQKALDIIKQAQQKYPDDADLQAKADYYMLFAPVSLFDLNPYTTGHFGFDVENDDKDTMGNTYEKSFRGYIDARNDGQDQTYDIGKKFNVLTGTCSIMTGGEGSEWTGSLKIYGDGQLLYSKINFISSTKPVDISVDITGITDLKIAMSTMPGADNSGPTMGVLFSNITLQRTVK